MLPARTDKLIGVLIQPNLFERSKDKILPNINRLDCSYSSSLTNTIITASGNYLLYSGSINENIVDITAYDDDQWQMYLTASQSEKYDGVLYSHDYLLRSGSTWITGSTPYWLSESVSPIITSSIESEYRFLSGSVTRSFAEVQDFIPAGIANHRFNGSKLTSPAFNVNSTQTIDGKPVVEWRTTNPNQLIYQSNGDQGSFVLV